MRNLLSTGMTTATMVLVLIGAGRATAGDPDASDAEMAAIPNWCKFPQYGTHGKLDDIPDLQIRAKLAGLNRSGCKGYHHYCWALTWADRAYTIFAENPSKASFQFGVAINDFNYVFDSSGKGSRCSLFPDMHTKIGAYKTLLNDPKGAEASFRAALEIKPGYAPAYVGLSDLYETLGKSDQAIEILQAGIKSNPKSSALKKKLDRLRARTVGQTATP